MKKINMLTDAIENDRIFEVKEILNSSFLNGYFLKNKRNSNGLTPLLVAIKTGKKEIFDYLLKLKVSVTKKSSMGNSPTTFSVFYAKEYMLKELTIKYKLKPSPDMTLLYTEENKKVKIKLLEHIFMCGWLSSLKLFIKSDLPLEDKYFPSISYADENFEEMLNYCINELKIDINTTNDAGETALFIATNLECADKINLLIAYGADTYNDSNDVIEEITNFLKER